MKNKPKWFVFLLVFLLCFFTAPNAVFANCKHGKPTHNDHILNGGVGQYGANHRYYWVSSSLSSGQQSIVATAVDQWVNTTYTPGVITSISIKKTINQTDSSFDVYKVSLPSGYTGKTNHAYYSNSVDPNNSNWGWTLLEIDFTQMNSLSYSTPKITGVVSHELGHAMGLAHRTDTDSVMYLYDTGRVYQRPTASDCHNINHIYG